ncbi:MAG: NYN domain-containing protein, partial [Aggregatilineales bacterium]
MPYLIDGHNLIAKLPDIDLSDNHDEAELIFKLRGFSARKRKKCIVIFDEGLPGGRSALSTHSVLVIFAASQRTNADNVIRERINETPDPGNWTVISSDNEVLAAAKGRGMKTMKCRDFAKILLTPARPTPEAGTEPHIQLSGDEVSQWMTE